MYDHSYQWDQPKVSREHLSLGGKVWEDWYQATKRDPHKRQGGIYSFANTHTHVQTQKIGFGTTNMLQDTMTANILCKV